MTLSPSQFGPLFHGSGAEIPVGKKVLPNDRVGALSDSRSGAVAYATPDEHTAWSFAAWNAPSARQRVYEVTPSKDARLLHSDGKEHFGAREDEVVASHFKVRKRIDIMPGRQGTFPEVNWSKYSHVDEGMRPEINHPDNDDPSLSPPPLADAPRVRTQAGMLQERQDAARKKRRYV